MNGARERSAEKEKVIRILMNLVTLSGATELFQKNSLKATKKFHPLTDLMNLKLQV